MSDSPTSLSFVAALTAREGCAYRTLPLGESAPLTIHIGSSEIGLEPGRLRELKLRELLCVNAARAALHKSCVSLDHLSAGSTQQPRTAVMYLGGVGRRGSLEAVAVAAAAARRSGMCAGSLSSVRVLTTSGGPDKAPAAHPGGSQVCDIYCLR